MVVVEEQTIDALPDIGRRMRTDGLGHCRGPTTLAVFVALPRVDV